MSCEPRWDKCDVKSYKHKVENTTEPFKPTNEAQLRLIVDNLAETLKDAETSSIPQKKTCSKKKKKFTWSPEIKEAYMKSKDAHRKWKHSGRPSDASHPLTISLKSSKQQFSNLQTNNSIQKDYGCRRHLQDVPQADKRATQYQLYSDILFSCARGNFNR